VQRESEELIQDKSWQLPAPNRYAPDSTWHVVFPPASSIMLAQPEGIITKSKKSTEMEMTITRVFPIITQNDGRALSDRTVF
jgi:hypothetical protein